MSLKGYITKCNSTKNKWCNNKAKRKGGVKWGIGAHLPTTMVHVFCI